jgi:hypothetical protein
MAPGQYSDEEIHSDNFVTLTAIHCLVMAFCWCLLMPAVVFGAHHLRQKSWWLTAMKWGSSTVLLLSTVAIGLILNRNHSTSTFNHSVGGIVLYVAALAQGAAGWCRPKISEEERHRRFSQCHAMFGYAVAAATYAFMAGGIFGIIVVYYTMSTWWVALVAIMYFTGAAIYASIPLIHVWQGGALTAAPTGTHEQTPRPPAHMASASPETATVAQTVSA